MHKSIWLLVAGSLSATASVVHLAIIAGGPGWYRFFGAGETMARMAELGQWRPALTTFSIAALLAVWSAYAFAGAGVLPRPPLLRTVLVMITTVYLVRGLAVIPLMALRPDLGHTFVWLSSAIVLLFGVVHAVGTWSAWPALSRPS